MPALAKRSRRGRLLLPRAAEKFCSLLSYYVGWRKRLWLSVEPDVLEAPAVIDAIDHRRQPLHLRLPAGRGDAVKDDRPSAILLQLTVDLPHEFLAFFLIGFGRLSVELFVELRIAVSAVIAVRAARVGFVELLVGIVGPAAGAVERDAIILPGHLGMPVGGLDDIELSVDIDLLQLIDQNDRRVPKL